MTVQHRSASGPSSDHPAEAAPLSPVAPGDIVGERYLVGTVLGEGGMGIVCEATHVALGVPVAIKLIRPAYKDDFEFVQRFLNEARRAALLKSEHVARVQDVGQLATGEPYLVMERLEGIVLDAYLQRAGPLLPEDAVALALQVCDGLAEAHAQGVVHRDIKPGNLFLVHMPNGRINVKILDFGISKQLKDDAPSTLTNRDKSLGSPWYMSPEQMMDSSSVDHRSDIWSLGVVLFELLTNQRPFDGASVPEVCAKVLTGGTPSLRAVHESIDRALEAVVFRCLAKDPADRYPDVLALADALQALSPGRMDSSSHRSWQPVGDYLGAAAVADKAVGSIAPLATTRKSGTPPLTVHEQRSRWLGVIAIVVSLSVAAVVVTNLLGASRSNHLAGFGVGPGSGLMPGPDPLPLDRGNTPLYLAVPGLSEPPPEVVPMPTDAGALAELEDDALPAEALEETGAPAARGPRGSPGERQRSERAGRQGRELSDALGRLRDEYTRSFALEAEPPAEREPDTNAETAAPSEPPEGASSRDDEAPARSRAPEPKDTPREPPSPISEAGDRYGL